MKSSSAQDRLMLLGRIFAGPKYVFFAITLFVLMLTTSVWLVNLPVLIHIFSQSSLTFIEKLLFLLSGYQNYFENLGNIQALTGLALALLVGVIGAVIIFLIKKESSTKGAKGAGAAGLLAVISSGCVACGTGLLAPFLGASLSTGAYLAGDRILVATSIGALINIAGLAFGIYALKGLLARAQPYLV